MFTTDLLTNHRTDTPAPSLIKIECLWIPTHDRLMGNHVIHMQVCLHCRLYGVSRAPEVSLDSDVVDRKGTNMCIGNSRRMWPAAAARRGARSDERQVVEAAKFTARKFNSPPSTWSSSPLLSPLSCLPALSLNLFLVRGWNFRNDFAARKIICWSYILATLYSSHLIAWILIDYCQGHIPSKNRFLIKHSNA